MTRTPQPATPQVHRFDGRPILRPSPPSRSRLRAARAALRVARAAILALLLSATVAPSASAVPLSEVVRAAVQDYPTIEQARANRESARFGIEQARAGHYPSVAVTSQRRMAGTAASLTQPQMNLNLYASGAIEAGVEREQYRERSLESAESVTREDVANAAATAWFRLYRAIRVQEANQRNLERHQRLADDFAAIASIDPGRRYDFVQARSRLEQIRQSVVTGEAEIAAAREGLLRYYPRPIDPSTLEAPTELPDPVPARDQAVLEDHPSVEAARRSLMSSEANARAARAQRGPRVDLQSTVGKDAASVVLLSWPAFDLARSAAEDAAAAALGAARASVREQSLIVRERYQTATQAWASAASREQVARGQIQAASELVEVYRQQFQIGRRNLLDLLNAFAELYQAEATLASSQVDRALSRHQIEYAAGRLSAIYAPSPR